MTDATCRGLLQGELTTQQIQQCQPFSSTAVSLNDHFRGDLVGLSNAATVDDAQRGADVTSHHCSETV